MNKYMTEHIFETADTLKKIDPVPIEKTIEILRKAKKDGNQVFLFGNGGSHSNASHFANDLLKACGIKAICISDMIPTILAYMNDDGKASMFIAPLLSFYNPTRDVLVGFSCSGDSSNVALALTDLADLVFDRTILLTGNDGGIAQTKAGTIIKVPHPNIRIQESCHSAICHAIVEALVSES